MTAIGKVQFLMSIAAVALGVLSGLLLDSVPRAVSDFALPIMFLSGVGAGLLIWVLHDLHKDGIV